MPTDDSKPPRTDRTSNVTAKQVRAFLAAAEHKSFSDAARQVCLSQSAFSRCIQELESALGDEVFTRSGQGPKLSEFGGAFLPHALRLMATYAEAQLGMEKWRASRQGKLTLAGSSSVMHVALPALLRRLRGEFRQPALLFEDCPSAQVVSRVLTGRAAMGVCTLISDEPELRCLHLLEAPMGLLIAPNRALPPSIGALADLSDLPLIRLAEDSVVSRVLRAHEIVFDAYHNSDIESCGVPGSFALVREENMVMLATGFGATHPQASDLRFVPLPDLLPSVKVSVITRRENTFDGPQQIMLDLVKNSILDTAWHASVRRIKKR